MCWKSGLVLSGGWGGRGGGGVRGGGQGVEGGVRWTIWECVRCNIWGKAADTNEECVGIKIVGWGFNSSVAAFSD